MSGPNKTKYRAAGDVALAWWAAAVADGDDDNEG